MATGVQPIVCRFTVPVFVVLVIVNRFSRKSFKTGQSGGGGILIVEKKLKKKKRTQLRTVRKCQSTIPM